MVDSIFRALPPFKGKQRLGRMLLKNLIRSQKDFIINGSRDCLYKIPNAVENVGFEILINGIYEPTTVDFISRKISQGGTLLDIGANIGAITIPVCRMRTDIKVIALEAAPWIFDYLNYNLKLNQVGQVEAVNQAIADVGGKRVNFFSPKDKFGKGSMSAVFTSEAVEVGTTTLDELSHQVKVNFIKIDVEGFEAQAFRGGQRLLQSPDSPNILFEFVDWAEKHAGEVPGTAQQILMDYGYSLYAFDNGRLHSKISLPLRQGSLLLFATKGAVESK